MIEKVDKEDGAGKNETTLIKRHKSEKEIGKPMKEYEIKCDEDSSNISLLHMCSFYTKKEFDVVNMKNYLWIKMKDKAKRKSDSEYDHYVSRKYLKFICFVKKYIKYYSDLKMRSYKISSYANNSKCLSSLSNPLDSMKRNSNPIVCTKEKNGLCKNNFKLKHKKHLSIWQKFQIYILNKMRYFFISPFFIPHNDDNRNSSNNNKGDEIKQLLTFRNEHSEDVFIDKFYSSLPFKMILYSTIMILISSINFFILHYVVFNIVHNVGKAAIYLNASKLFFDVLYFSFFVTYIFLFSSNCIDRILYYSYNSCYIFAFLTLLSNFILLQLLSPSVSTNLVKHSQPGVLTHICTSMQTDDFINHMSPHETAKENLSILPRTHDIMIMMNYIYLSLLCSLRNYMILYDFSLSFKFSIFCMFCVFIFSTYSYFYLQFSYNYMVVLFCLSLCLIVFSLCYEYSYEKRCRCLFIRGKEAEKADVDEANKEDEPVKRDEPAKGDETNEEDKADETDKADEADEAEEAEAEEEVYSKKRPNHYMTKYFSIENSIPMSPIEDILNNLKSLVDQMKKLEEDADEKKLSEISKMLEKIKKCENILRTQNLNEVQIYKYRNFERVYNMWCLDKIESTYCEKNEEFRSLSQSLNRKSFNSFSNIQSLLTYKFQEQHNESYEWNADIELLYKRNVFISIGYKLLFPLGVLEASFDKEKLKNFLTKMYSLYNEVPYHNSLHAAQVAHFSKSMLFLLEINHKISAIDEFCLHVSSLCHDVGHPGLNNYFLINSENNLALTYNDNSVLENYHCSLVFKTLKEKNCNIFENYPYNIFITCKKNIIKAILSTDMKNHFEYISNFRTSKEFIDFDILTSDQIWQIFSLILKAADIGHATLEWDKHYEWTMKINEEFYLQGLLEKSLDMPKSFLCDITTIDKLSTSQIGFLKHLCCPLFTELNSIAKNNEIYIHCICSIENNIEMWEKNKNNQKNLGLYEKYKNENLADRFKLLKFV
ncbi:3',5'-cyclic nucleotide phosphodiesterase [Plasmodium gonderi]|uniref:Phosphodiesterase n=1 Tax=Plasmodium gonderi TaxID=77519 RepID=A0A1Y1JMM6_PLAGO|nr:3',5'-cyclic nucleotide phosphodiesterase [Plasmodium gonderi]GAW82828.1 3',5'-cyclic nucleotide phosphodiesterase [Plasmodium gonderi]